MMGGAMFFKVKCTACGRTAEAHEAFGINELGKYTATHVIEPCLCGSKIFEVQKDVPLYPQRKKA